LARELQWVVVGRQIDEWRAWKRHVLLRRFFCQ